MEDPEEPFILYSDWFSDGVQQSAEYGYAVASAGDVDGDGYTDVLIGAPQVELNAYREGVAFLFSGNPQGLGDQPSWKAGGGVKGARFGHSLAGAGDLNCDGYDDVAIGAPRYNGGQPEEGAVFVFYGSPDGLAEIPDWSIQSDVKNARFGVSVAGAGDVNNDGCDDLLVGAHWYSNGQINEGAAFLFQGSLQGLPITPTWQVESDQDGSSIRLLGQLGRRSQPRQLRGCDRGRPGLHGGRYPRGQRLCLPRLGFRPAQHRHPPPGKGPGLLSLRRFSCRGGGPERRWLQRHRHRRATVR